MVNASAPEISKSFDDILSKVMFYSSKYHRTDIVFDVYKQQSLKSETISKRGSGFRRRVSGNSKTPMNWKGFLHDSDNKTELFHFLAEKMASTRTTNIVITIRGEDALVNQEMAPNDISPCSQKEADTCIFVHAKSAVSHGSKSLMIKANDTDIVALAVFIMMPLKEMGLDQLWIAFGQGILWQS